MLVNNKRDLYGWEAGGGGSVDGYSYDGDYPYSAAEGWEQVIPGLGADFSQALVQHLLVKTVSFTGLMPAGASVAKSASTTITPVVLELGGKNAFIVYDGADLDKAVRAALEEAFFNKGEACRAASYNLVQNAV